MFLDLFIIPSNGSIIDEVKVNRTIQSSKDIVYQYWQAKSWKQINETRKTNFYYGIVYDREWFDPRLAKELQIVLLASMNIDMFSLFCASGGGEVRFEPRIFNSNLLLNPDITNQPLPYNHERLKFEKLIGGWLYVD